MSVLEVKQFDTPDFKVVETSQFDVPLIEVFDLHLDGFHPLEQSLHVCVVILNCSITLALWEVQLSDEVEQVTVNGELTDVVIGEAHPAFIVVNLLDPYKLIGNAPKILDLNSYALLWIAP